MINLLDGVKSAEIKITKEVGSLSDMVKDSNLSMVDRIESFEDIISIEVGDTSLNRARNLERELNIKQLYIKYEGENPSGIAIPGDLFYEDPHEGRPPVVE